MLGCAGGGGVWLGCCLCFGCYGCLGYEAVCGVRAGG